MEPASEEKKTNSAVAVNSRLTGIPEASKFLINLHNIEKGLQPDLENEVAGELVTWDGDDDPDDPLNWPTHRRMTITMLLSLGGLVSLMSASMIAPALTQISSDLQIGPASTSLTLSIYLLAFAFGPLIIGPVSEMYGRKPVWIFCHLWYILWNALCPVNKSRGLMIAGRFMSGLGGSVGIALPGPIMADIWRIEKRGKSLALSMFAPYLGAAVGPILGGFISQNVGWPWLFWTVSIFDSVLLALASVAIQESYAPVLLAKKSARLEAETGIKHYTAFEKINTTWSSKLATSLGRPFKLLATRPVIQLTAFFIAYNFGAYCIALTTVAEIWTKRYHQSVSASGLHYIAISIGSSVSSQVSGVLMDRLWAYLKSKAKGNHSPEFRVPLMIPGTLIMPAGLVLYGWSAERRLAWIITDIGICIFTFGLMSSSQASNAYLIDEFAEHAASANAASRFLSNLMGFVFPLFAPQLYESLGYGWGNSLLALLFMVVGLPMPLVLWKWGSKIRAIGKRKP